MYFFVIVICISAYLKLYFSWYRRPGPSPRCRNYILLQLNLLIWQKILKKKYYYWINLNIQKSNQQKKKSSVFLPKGEANFWFFFWQGGGGVGQFLIWLTRRGGGDSATPFFADILCEQPLIPVNVNIIVDMCSGVHWNVLEHIKCISEKGEFLEI